jgi:cytochrome b involved in lipid metabolism
MGKGGKSSDASDKVKQEVLIDGRFYDVTGFRHPGARLSYLL